MQATRGAALSRPAGVGSGHRRPLVGFAVAAIAVIAADQISKAIAVARLTPGFPRRVIGSFLQLDLTRNAGAAFSIGTGSTIIFTAAAVIVAAVIARTARRIASTRWGIGLGLLMGGAIGNLCDRLFRAPGVFRGHVVDWIQLPHWPVFNVADSAITVGVVVVLVLSLTGVAMTPVAQQEAHDPVGPGRAGDQ